MLGEGWRKRTGRAEGRKRDETHHVQLPACGSRRHTLRRNMRTAIMTDAREWSIKLMKADRKKEAYRKIIKVVTSAAGPPSAPTGEG